MALLSPAWPDIRNKPFNGGNPRQIINSIFSKEVQNPSVKIALRVRVQLQGQGSVEDGDEDKIPAPVKRALEKAKDYKKQQQNQNDCAPNVPESEFVSSEPKGTGGAAFDALERARAYKKQQGEKSYPKEDNTVEVEIITKDGVIRRRVTPPEQAFSNVKSYKNKGISSIDFIGLEFSEKKPKRGLPAGLNIGLELPSSGTLPEVEIITRDAAKNVKTPPGNDNSSGLYKPKVATWGIFPRPENISKTVLKEGNELMEIGKLREALVLYEKIMEEMVFQSELHGLAALQWSVCLDSISSGNNQIQQWHKHSPFSLL